MCLFMYLYVFPDSSFYYCGVIFYYYYYFVKLQHTITQPSDLTSPCTLKKQIYFLCSLLFLFPWQCDRE